MSIQSDLIKEPDEIYNNIYITEDNTNEVSWCIMRKSHKACFTYDLLNEIRDSQKKFIEKQNHRFYVLSSESKSVFSFGGDLELFLQLIKDHDKKALHQYMKLCIDTVYGFSMLPSCEGIALVQGSAFGGGFEAALACDTIIAEESATFGFPERLFNTFPGMGAYSYLIRKIDPIKAQKIIKSANTYTAKELHDIGIIDKVVPDGDGHDAVYNHISHYKKYYNSFNSFKQVTQSLNPISYNELIQIGELWVNSVLNLTRRDVSLIKKLIHSQNHLLMNT